MYLGYICNLNLICFINRNFYKWSVLKCEFIIRSSGFFGGYSDERN